jgi:hypothetical protein
MRRPASTVCALLLCCIATTAWAGDDVKYLSCRADNEDAPSLIMIDETTRKVCDREFGSGWITPLIFNSSTVEWGDGPSRKSITQGKKGSRYEHDSYFIVVHIGHCTKLKAPSAPPCNG